MPVVVVADDPATAAGEQIRCRKPRTPPDNPETDPNPIRTKTTISSILISSTNETTSKKKNFTSATFRGLGCAASSQVSVPAVIRTSANWESKKLKKKRLKTKINTNDNLLLPPPIISSDSSSRDNPSSISMALSSSSCVGVPDVWCGPGLGLVTDASSVDCVVSRRPARGKVDAADRILLAQRERPYNSVRRMVSPEENPFIESDSAFGINRFRSDFSGSRHHHHRHHHHLRHGAFHGGLAEIVMLQSNLMMGGRSDRLDRYRDLRLDVDNMSYEELLDLGDRIGHVSTGLREDEITGCLSKTKLAMFEDLSRHFATELERKCTICQEEYEAGDETGKLKCGHSYHIYCIEQWLGRKNTCPVCKTPALSQS
ncbi:hypothetical protein ABFS82_04G136400 [Erythranthe guttata]|uniref:RING-type E3 ubiquitin transferase n=1 Tax=Erythranthe guttata TaxID=4155 RepID=A0A022RVM7_ERYGU|nr:PREDICTED: uncharacterized protein LOC105976140 [Erythranthe guttata]EYU44114.1 hypothetical protein MIMGU_mgv1a008514mg [Erythranthe guttata]|eukprot:XP_012856892.1 PREDICTED: uncharacterized protein LOC105976140 [Erythranthe guttata]